MGKTINGSVMEEKKGTLFKSLVANTVLMGDDTDLLMLLCYYTEMSAEELFFQSRARANSTKRRLEWESNLGHIGGRRVLSPLYHPCTPVQVLMRSLKTSGGLTRGHGMTGRQRGIWLLFMPACAEMNRTMLELTGVSYSTGEQNMTKPEKPGT